MGNSFIFIIIFIVSSTVYADNVVPKSCQALFDGTTESGRSGILFLHQKNPSLHLSTPVERNTQRVFLANNVRLQKPNQKIESWLKYLEKISQRSHKDQKTLTRLKQSYYKMYVTRQSEISQNYYDLQVRLHRERGHGNVVLDEATKFQLAEILIKDQQKSLDSWIEYLVSPDSSSYPMWSKFWAFNSIVKMSKWNPDKQSFGNREKGQTSPFPELNREAFALVVDALIKKLDKKNLHEIQDPIFLNLLDGASFAKLYARAIVLSESQKSIATTNEGIWVTYPKGSDHIPLVKSLEGKNTGWCTAGESTAESQLSHGDFHVYYSFDQFRNPTIPRVAIRMENSQIAEVRGIGKDQNLDPKISGSKIVSKKLKTFGGEGEKYQKKSLDMTRLTAIDKKSKQGEDLTKEDLRFIYEFDQPIEAFGYKKDPRIEEILKSRSAKKDFAIAFELDAKESEIAFTIEEALSDHTRYAINKIIFSAIIEKHPSTSMLIDKVIDVNAKDSDGNTLLYLAIIHNQKLISKLIEKGADVNANNGEALVEASRRGFVKIVQILVEGGANVNATDVIEGKTPLMWAIQEGHTEAALKLIENGADVNVKDKKGNTALILTENNLHPEIALSIIKNGADVNVKNISGISALLIAAADHKKEGVALKLIERGADLDVMDTYGQTPLMWASIRGSTELAKQLIKKGADINAKDKENDTALVLALSHGRPEIASALLEKGADVNIVNINGQSALAAAKRKGYTEIANLLKNRGAKE